MALALTLLVLGMFFSYMLIPILRWRRDRRLASANGAQVERPASKAPPSQSFTGVASAAPSSTPAAAAAPEVPTIKPIQSIPPRERQHTVIAGMTGDGKNTTVNTLLVWDIVHGVHPIVCSTHFTPYHPEDQPIDLRPIAHLFEAAYTLPAIAAVLTYACDQIDGRMERYRAGLDVGQDIVLYLGEWGAIRRGLGDMAVDALMKILDEGRKTRVWIGAMELHSALVGRLGGDSGLREAFTTRLAGNIDTTTWRLFVGKEYKQQPVPRGHWMTEDGLTEVVRPTKKQISMIAERKQKTWEPIISGAVLHPPVLRDEITIERALASIEANTGQNTASNTGETPAENTGAKLTKARIKSIREIAALGASRNQMAGMIGGDKRHALGLIAEVLGPVADQVDAEVEAVEQPVEGVAQ